MSRSELHLPRSKHNPVSSSRGLKINIQVPLKARNLSRRWSALSITTISSLCVPPNPDSCVISTLPTLYISGFPISVWQRDSTGLRQGYAGCNNYTGLLTVVGARVERLQDNPHITNVKCAEQSFPIKVHFDLQLLSIYCHKQRGKTVKLYRGTSVVG